MTSLSTLTGISGGYALRPQRDEMPLLIEFATDLIRSGTQVGCVAQQNIKRLKPGRIHAGNRLYEQSATSIERMNA
ncbi:hypothetical protein NKL05_30280 [Mesorhizobium sp. C420B]|uniref:hypothetical protein n=2 Tax=Mesorhizobium TaxID=68287 RepID=UPI0012ECA714|nr:hypothetical protein [Mesorhizobium sp. LSHC420B00]